MEASTSCFTAAVLLVVTLAVSPAANVSSTVTAFASMVVGRHFGAGCFLVGGTGVVLAVVCLG